MSYSGGEQTQGRHMRNIAYLRVSTDKQGLSLEAQREVCRKFTDLKGGRIDVEIIDEDVSGSTELEKRKALLDAINGMQKGDVLLVAKRDRLGRDPIVNAMIERAVERKGGRIVSAGGDVQEGDDPTSILMRRMIDAFSEYERLLIGARTKAALQTKKNKRERVGHVPLGFALAADGVHLIECPEEQSILKQLQDLRVSGLSIRQIVSAMNERGLFNRKGKWTISSVHRILNRAA